MIDELKNLPDEELFARIRDKSDNAAFNTLYERFRRRLFAYCLRALEDRATAQDAFQTIVMTIVEKKQSFIGGNFMAWLMTIARNEVLQTKRKRKPTVDIEPLAEELSADTTEGDVTERDIVRQAMSALPEDFREVIELRYIDDLSYEQMADILQISLSLVKVRLFRAKKILATRLAGLREDAL